MYYWETDLNPCCDLEEGWVSIQSIQSPGGCWFLWAGSDDGDLVSYQNSGQQSTDVAFELTKVGPDPIPLICCDPVGLYFGDKLPAGIIVTGQIYVCNCGTPGSYLNWYVDTTNVPSWGTWTFTPNSGTGVPETGPCAIVNVTCVVTTAGTYTGDIYVYNADDPTDFCKCTTGGTWPRPKALNYPFIAWLIQQFPFLKTLLRL
jgi:hypothetical protein